MAVDSTPTQNQNQNQNKPPPTHTKPKTPPQPVSLGDATTDEMMLVFFALTYYFPGDENILIDSSLITATDDYSFAGIISSLQLYEPYPNPARDILDFQFYSVKPGPVDVEVYDRSGRSVMQAAEKCHAGVNRASLSLDRLAAGAYILTIRQGETARSKPFLVTD
jgi:hypothetical protein